MEPSNRDAIDRFFGYPDYAVVGVSRRGKGFGWAALNELKQRGYSAFAVNRFPGTFHGKTFYGAVSDIPSRPKAAVVTTPPQETGSLVRELINQGVEAVWLQRGAESEEAVQFCRENRVNVVNGWCILMFAEPVSSVHRWHRGFLGLTGRLPRRD